MDYIAITEMPPLAPVLYSALQTLVLFLFILIVLRMIGRRVFGEHNPQDLITLILIAEACGAGLNDQRAGFWGSAASVCTILLIGWMMDRIPALRRLIESGPVTLYNNGRLFRKAMKENMIDTDELDTVARRYGLRSYREFSRIVLEGDGEITASIKNGGDGAGNLPARNTRHKPNL